MRFKDIRITTFIAIGMVSILAVTHSDSLEAQIEEVVVTAQKRVTTVQDTPIAVSAFSGGELDRALINKSLDLQFNVPNMLMSKGNFTSASISLRGIGNLAIGPAADSGTGSHFNGVYLNNGRIFELEYYDAERVEVLRGPQGTLYGRNTTAGVVNFITKKPQDEFGGNIDVELGNYNHRKVKGAINLPVTDNLAQRFAVFYNERDGFVDNLYTGNDVDGRDMYSVRSATGWTTPSFEATLTVNYFEEDSDRLRGSNQACTRDPDGIIGCLPGSLGDDTPHSGATAGGFLLGLLGPAAGLSFPEDDFLGSPSSSDPRKQFLDYEPQYSVKDTMVSLEANWSLNDEYTLTSLSGFHRSRYSASNDFDFTVAAGKWPLDVTLPLPGGTSVTVDRIYNVDLTSTRPEQWTQELRLATQFSGDWNFLVGGFYLDYEASGNFQIYSSAVELVGLALGVPSSQRLYDNDTKSYQLETYAVFGEAYWQATEDVTLTFGLRYTEEEKRSLQRTVYLSFLDDPTSDNGGVREFNGSWSEPTGKVNVTWNVNDDILAYATASRSYKSGGFNPVAAQSALLDPARGGSPERGEFDPEYINAIEMGAKMRFLSNELQANIAYFYYDYEGLQIGTSVSQTPINDNFNATLQGFEGEFIFVPNEHWRFSANLAWLDTQIDGGELVDTADINLLGTVENIVNGPLSNIYIGPGCPGGVSSCEGLVQQLDGNRLPNAPEFSVNLGVGYAWQLDNGMELVAGTNFYWQDKFYTRVFNAANDEVDAWEVWNATLTLNSSDRVWYSSLWVRNLKDDDFVTGQFIGGQNLGLATNQFLLEPRLLGISAGYNF